MRTGTAVKTASARVLLVLGAVAGGLAGGDDALSFTKSTPSHRAPVATQPVSGGNVAEGGTGLYPNRAGRRSSAPQAAARSPISRPRPRSPSP